MKVLIVDDEQHVRDTVKMLMEWEQYGIKEVYEADNGLAAMRMVETKMPELILTDVMMPIKNGVQFLGWLQKNAPQCKSVVISGHDDFDFVRHTMKYGGIDYILKPIDPLQLQQAVEKAVEAWKRENQALYLDKAQHIKLNQIKPVYWEKIFTGLVDCSIPSPSAVQEVKHEFGTDCSDPCLVAVMDIQWIFQKVKEKFKKHEDLLMFSITNVANEILSRRGLGFAFRYWSHHNEIVLVLWKEMNHIKERLEQINQAIAETLGTRFHIGIGSPAMMKEGLHESYNMARKALRNRNLLQPQHWIHVCSSSREESLVWVHFSDFEEEMKLAIQSCQKSIIQCAVDRWIRVVKEMNFISPEQMDLWRQEYLLFVSRFLQEFPSNEGPTHLFEEKWDDLVIFLNEDGNLSLRQMEIGLTKLMMEFSRYLQDRQKRSNHAIYQIAEYLEKHYRQDLNLQHIADHFYLSREYISRKFKQEFGRNITDFVSNLRMKKAKILLRNPEFKICQIAEMVGYKDEKYFSKVLKKMVGVSPNQYRKKKA